MNELLLDALRFSLSFVLAAVMVACSPNTPTSTAVAGTEEYPTIWQEPSLDEKAGWCRADRQCQSLAEAVVYESRGERDMGKYAVAWVIRNRAESPRWPNTIRQVIHQRFQFSYIGDKHEQETPTKKDWTTAYIVGYDVLNDLIESPVNDATHYHEIGIIPTWARRLEIVARIDNHIFYR